MQTVQTLVSRRVLIWVYTVCLRPKNGTLNIKGLNLLSTNLILDPNLIMNQHKNTYKVRLA